MRKANLNGVNQYIKRHPVIGRILSLLYVAYLMVIFIPACFWYGAKEMIPECFDAGRKALGVAFLPWGDV